MSAYEQRSASRAQDGAVNQQTGGGVDAAEGPASLLQSNAFLAQGMSAMADIGSPAMPGAASLLNLVASMPGQHAFGPVTAASADPHGVSPEERASLDERFGEEVVEVWLEQFRDQIFSGDHQLQVIGSTVSDAKGSFDKASKVAEAVDALQGLTASSPPSDGLRLMLQLYGLVGVFCTVSPGFRGFLLYYEVALEEVIEGVDKVVAGVREWDRQGAIVIHSEGHPGGAALHVYMIEMFESSAPVPVTGPVMAWVKDNHAQLEFITGADPGAERHELGGIDLLWPDREDPEFVTKFMFVARGPIKRFVYGHLALDMKDLRRSSSERYPPFVLKDLFI